MSVLSGRESYASILSAGNCEGVQKSRFWSLGLCSEGSERVQTLRGSAFVIAPHVKHRPSPRLYSRAGAGIRIHLDSHSGHLSLQDTFKQVQRPEKKAC